MFVLTSAVPPMLPFEVRLVSLDLFYAAPQNGAIGMPPFLSIHLDQRIAIHIGNLDGCSW
jgi:hypothetical protein